MGLMRIYIYIYISNSVALVRERTIPTERPPLVGGQLLRIEGCRMVSAADPYKMQRAIKHTLSEPVDVSRVEC
jgi:hypothetical protein